MRADRLLSILLLLQAHGRLTARDLARRLEVSERTIHRDMDALGVAGVPVYAERGAGGGWSLAEGYRARLPGLSDTEIQALFLAGPARLLADLGLRRASEAALLKLLAALPALARRDVEYARQRIHVDPAGWYESAESVAALPALQEAIWQGGQVAITYRRGDGATVERVVAPLGLVAKGRVWYLVAAVEGEPRTYRVSRVQCARPTGEPAARPAGFDLAAYWARSAADFKAGLPATPRPCGSPPTSSRACARRPATRARRARRPARPRRLGHPRPALRGGGGSLRMGARLRPADRGPRPARPPRARHPPGRGGRRRLRAPPAPALTRRRPSRPDLIASPPLAAETPARIGRTSWRRLAHQPGRRRRAARPRHRAHGAGQVRRTR